MYRVSLNTALYYIKKESKHSDIHKLKENTSELPDFQTDDYAHDEELKLLLNAIDKLNKIDKAIILLYLDKKSYEEISDICGYTRSNVSVRLVRIKRQLEVEVRKFTNK